MAYSTYDSANQRKTEGDCESPHGASPTRMPSEKGALPIKWRAPRRARVRVKDIGNTSVQGHGLHLEGQVIPLCATLIKSPQLYRPEIHLPHPIRYLLQAYRLSQQEIPHINPLGIRIYHTARAHPVRAHPRGIHQLRQTFGVRT